ncbi:hypothetical protein GQ457_16G027690 [Hibiscus cannabinus]
MCLSPTNNIPPQSPRHAPPYFLHSTSRFLSRIFFFFFLFRKQLKIGCVAIPDLTCFHSKGFMTVSALQ